MKGGAIPQGQKWLDSLPVATASGLPVGDGIYIGVVQGVTNIALRAFRAAGNVVDIRVLKASENGGLWAYDATRDRFYESTITDDVIGQILEDSGLEEAYTAVSSSVVQVMSKVDVVFKVVPAE